jgi:chemotaxis protein MotA
MITIVGVLFGLICIFTGYLLHGGPMGIFIEAWTEYIVIIGGAFGIFLGSNGVGVLKATIAAVLGLLKPSPYTKEEFLKLLVMLYQIFSVARRDGLLAMEEHVENPGKSPILGKNATFVHDHHAAHFFCDTMKVIMSGGVTPHDLSDMMEVDLENMHKEEHVIPDAIQNAADAMPAVGIVACVLGVIITMGKIGGDPKDIGHAVGIALVGTFLGILVSYVCVAPFAKAITARNNIQSQYMNCLRAALFSFARGEAPVTCVEFARRNIEPLNRPSFHEVEKAFKDAKKQG